MSSHRASRRFISFVLSLSMFCTQAAFAHTAQLAAFPAPALRLSTGLSSHYGRATPFVFPENPAGARTVILIRDIHRNLEAQHGIGVFLSGLIRHRQVELIALEGAFGSLDLEPFQAFPDKRGLAQVADGLLRAHEIAGPVHAVLNSEFSSVVGVDDRARYHANVRAYRASAPAADALKREWASRRESLDARKIAEFNPALAAFDAQAGAFRRGALTLGDYARLLSAAAPAPSPARDALDRFAEAVRRESALDMEAVNAQKSHLLAALLPKLSAAETHWLTETSMAFRAGRVRQADLCAHLRRLCGAHRVSLARFPALLAYFAYVDLADRIDGRDLLEAMRRVEQEVYAALARRDAERALVEMSRRLDLEEKLLNFSLTRDDWDVYRRFSGGDPRLAHFENFYHEAQARDAAMARNLLAEMSRRGARTAALVTGGFHAPGIDAILTEAGVSVVPFTPRVTRVDSTGGASYLNEFCREKTPLETLFRGETLFLAKMAWPRAVKGLAALRLLFWADAAGLDGEWEERLERMITPGVDSLVAVFGAPGVGIALIATPAAVSLVAESRDDGAIDPLVIVPLSGLDDCRRLAASILRAAMPVSGAFARELDFLAGMFGSPGPLDSLIRHLDDLRRLARTLADVESGAGGRLCAQVTLAAHVVALGLKSIPIDKKIGAVAADLMSDPEGNRLTPAELMDFELWGLSDEAADRLNLAFHRAGVADYPEKLKILERLPARMELIARAQRALPALVRDIQVLIFGSNEETMRGAAFPALAGFVGRSLRAGELVRFETLPHDRASAVAHVDFSQVESIEQLYAEWDRASDRWWESLMAPRFLARVLSFTAEGDALGSIPGAELRMVDEMLAGLHRTSGVPSAESGPGLILEIAAGAGPLTMALARRLDPRFRIVAMDLIPELLQALEKNLVEHVPDADRRSRVQTVTASATRPPFPNGSVARVYLRSAAFLMSDRQRHRLLAEAFRVLRPGGDIVFLETDPDTRVESDDPGAWGWTADEWRRHLERAGFDPAAIDLRSAGYGVLGLHARKPDAGNNAPATIPGAIDDQYSRWIVSRGGGLGWIGFFEGVVRQMLRFSVVPASIAIALSIVAPGLAIPLWLTLPALVLYARRMARRSYHDFYWRHFFDGVRTREGPIVNNPVAAEAASRTAMWGWLGLAFALPGFVVVLSVPGWAWLGWILAGAGVVAGGLGHAIANKRAGRAIEGQAPDVWALRAGGTFDMAPRTDRDPRRPGNGADVLMTNGRIGRVETAFNGKMPDSSAVGPAEWPALIRQLRRLIREKAGRPGGLVLTFGSDTAEDAGLILSLALADDLEAAGVPLVITVANRPASENDSDAPRNFRDAATLARRWGLPPRVYFVYAGRAALASQIRKVVGSAPAGPAGRRRHQTLDHFDVDGPVIASFGADGRMMLHPGAFSRRAPSAPLGEASSFGYVEHLIVDRSTPLRVLRDCAYRLYARRRAGERVGLVVQGPVPDVRDHRLLLGELRRAGIPVLTDGPGELARLRHGSARNKLAFLLGLGVHPERISGLMARDLAGEAGGRPSWREPAPELTFPPNNPSRGEAVIVAFPGMGADVIDDAVRQLADANASRPRIVLYGFGDGHLPIRGPGDPLLTALRNASAAGVAVIVRSRAPLTHADLSMYEIGRLMNEAGAFTEIHRDDGPRLGTDRFRHWRTGDRVEVLVGASVRAFDLGAREAMDPDQADLWVGREVIDGTQTDRLVGLSSDPRDEIELAHHSPFLEPVILRLVHRSPDGVGLYERADEPPSSLEEWVRSASESDQRRVRDVKELESAIGIAATLHKVIGLVSPFDENGSGGGAVIRVWNRLVADVDLQRERESPGLADAVRLLTRRQSAVGRVVEDPSKGRTWRSFFRIPDDGRTPLFAVYLPGEREPRLFPRRVPLEIARQAQFIAIQNIGRSKRPGPAADKRPAPNDEGTRMISFSRMKREELDEMYAVIRAGRHAWALLPNPFRIWPGDEHYTVSRTDEDVPQTDILLHDNLQDLMQILAHLNGAGTSETGEARKELAQVAERALKIMTGRGKSFNAVLAPAAAGETSGESPFWIGLNGGYHSDAPDAPRGGATQFLAHAQLGNSYLPVFGRPLQFRKMVGQVRVLTFADPRQAGLILESRGIRVFLVERRQTTGKPFLGNVSGYPEAFGGPVVAAADFFSGMTAEDEAELAASSDPSGWLQEKQRAGRLTTVRPDLKERIIGSLSALNSPQADHEEILERLGPSVAGGESNLLHLLLSFFLTPGRWSYVTLASVALIEGPGLWWAALNAGSFAAIAGAFMLVHLAARVGLSARRQISGVSVLTGSLSDAVVLGLYLLLPGWAAIAAHALIDVFWIRIGLTNVAGRAFSPEQEAALIDQALTIRPLGAADLAGATVRNGLLQFALVEVRSAGDLKAARPLALDARRAPADRARAVFLVTADGHAGRKMAAELRDLSAGSAAVLTNSDLRPFRAPMDGGAPAIDVSAVLRHLSQSPSTPRYHWLDDPGEMDSTRFVLTARTPGWRVGDDPLFSRARFVIDVIAESVRARMPLREFERLMRESSRVSSAA